MHQYGWRVVLLTAIFFSTSSHSVQAQVPAPGYPIGYFCEPYLTSFENDKHYLPEVFNELGHARCTYTAETFPFARKEGVFYRGIPGNAQSGSHHFMGFNAVQTEIEDLGGLQEGNPVFIVIAVIRPFTNDSNEFEQYFATGIGAPPHGDYGILEWEWGAKPASEYDPVVIIPGILGSWEKNDEWVIDPVLHVYDDLIETFEANEYVKGETLFPFAYDWRDSNVVTANLLKKEIARIRSICNCAKVDVVAHSMGGLVARAYAQGDEYQNDIDQLVFLGTPHLGAPKSYLTWEGGELETLDITDWIVERIFISEAEKGGYSDLFDYVRNKPIRSIQELLPTFNYLSEDQNLRTYPTSYPVNSFIENLTATAQNLFSRKIRYKNIVGNIPEGAIDAFDVIPSAELPKWEHGKPETILYARGDKTVPYRSSQIPGQIRVDGELPAEHGDLTSAASNYAFNLFNNKSASPIIDNGHFPNVGIVLIQLFSPIDMVITAQNGKKLGKDFASGDEINEISGAFYSGFIGDNEYAVIPDPLNGKYLIETIGTGNGEYTIVTSFITDTSATTSEVSGVVQEGEIAKALLAVDTITGVIEIEAVPTDVTPPSIVMYSPTSTRYTRLDVINVNVVITDASEIVFSAYLLNGSLVDTALPLPFTSMDLGTSTLEIGATDEFGNNASLSVAFVLGATPQSAIADVNRAYENGWILKPSVRDSLIKKFLDLQKLLTKRKEILASELSEKKKKTLLKTNMNGIKKLLEKDIPYILSKQRKYLTQQATNLIQENVDWLRAELI